MAYGATQTRTADKAEAPINTVVVIDEIDAAATSEFSITVPKVGTIMLYQADLVSGTGTTITPRIGKVDTFVADSHDEIDVASAAAAHHNIQTATRYYAPEGKLYIRNGVDAGTDNVLKTTIVIRPGHHV